MRNANDEIMEKEYSAARKPKGEEKH